MQYIYYTREREEEEEETEELETGPNGTDLLR